ncbi:TIGR02679 family protein [Planomonospora corallina]|uniref:TIGR02679 family protein n=1 Tax=Planomonospora corallina TaxID=1806052 RepID=A0ABV8IJ98_9ACTN
MTSADEPQGEGWKRLLAAARRSLERGGALTGSVGLNDPSEAERRVVIGITGRYRPESVKRLTVSLSELDAALSARYGSGLREVLTGLGGPIRDRAAERAALEWERERLLGLAGDSRHVAEPWFSAWLDELAAGGTLTRLVRRGDGRLLVQATGVLDLLPSPPRSSLAPAAPAETGEQILPLPVLAERATGDTKSLAPGSPLASLVLRALALRSGLPAVPGDRTGQRRLWESAGVIMDDLASQVLVLNIRTRRTGVASGWLNEAARYGIPFRLTLQQQTVSPVVPSSGKIYVCENPAVLRTAAADLGARAPALVCTEGIPSAACHRLLDAAVTAGARLRWRADFDWTGLRIVDRAISRYDAAPWRMATADYTAGLAGGESTALTGSPALSPWDPGLAELMAACDRAVMEERLLPSLLADLRPEP